MDREMLKHWKEMFYADEWNPAIRFFKKTCAWVIMNVPDASMTTGFTRYAVNMAVVLISAVLAWQVFLHNNGLLQLAIGLYAVSFVPGILFSKSVAAGILLGLENYQLLMEKALGDGRNNEFVRQAASDLFDDG